MKFKLIIIISFFCLFSCKQNSESNDFYELLSSEKGNLSYSFLPRFTNYLIVLEKNPKEDSDCSKIDKKKSQKIIEILKKYELLNKENAFLESSSQTEQNRRLSQSRKLLILVERKKSDLIIEVQEIDLAKNLLLEIGTELNYQECFTELSSRIKT